MNLVLIGHDYKYAVEQILLSLFPNERPHYTSLSAWDDMNESCAVISVGEGMQYWQASTKLRYNGRESFNKARVRKTKFTDPVTRSSLCQSTIKRSFYLSAESLLPRKPPWGAVTTVRPGKIMTQIVKESKSYAAAISAFERDYYVDHDKALLCLDTASASLEARALLRPGDVALYVGIPFCPTRCTYCSFVSQSIEKSSGLIEPYLDALYRELDAIADAVRELNLHIISVYIGGGTPTILNAEQLESLFIKLKTSFDLGEVKEFCVEAGRPDTIDKDKIRAMKNADVTRVCVNPQSMSQNVLDAIGRPHTPYDVMQAFREVKLGTHAEVNMDLIAGLPMDTVDGFSDSLERLIRMSPENITIHTLARKKGSAITLEDTELPNDEDVAEMLAIAQQDLSEAGYTPYYLYRQKYSSGGFENVGWARNRKVGLYNILIMEELTTILAAGGGASTKLVDRYTGRIERVFDYKYPKEYIEGIDKIIADKKKILEFYKDGD